MSASRAISVQRGASLTLRYTVSRESDGELVDLTGAQVEFQIKAKDTDADPPLLALSIGNGVALSNQVLTPGEFTIDLEPAHTLALAAGDYRYDVWAILPSSERLVVVRPSWFQLKASVNIPEGASPPPATVLDLAALALIDTSAMDSGEVRFVAEGADFYWLNKANAEQVDGLNVVQAVPSGRWIRHVRPLVAELQADWSLSQTRYYAISYVNGNDSNKGYIDAAPGTQFDPADVRAIALKTYEEFYQRVPKQGAGRKLVLLIEGDANAVTPIRYYAKDGVTLDKPNVDGIAGYSRFIMRASDFTNSVNDWMDCAQMLDTTTLGPGAGSSWTVGVWADPILTVASGVVPTGTEFVGRKIQWEGNVNANLRTRCGFVKATYAGGQMEIAPLGGGQVPQVGDRFTLRVPSVVFDAPTGKADVLYVRPNPFQAPYGIQTIGMTFEPQAAPSQINILSWTPRACRVILAAGRHWSVAERGVWNMTSTAFDDTDTARVYGFSIFYDGAVTNTCEHVGGDSSSGGGGSINYFASKCRVTFNNVKGYPNIGFASAVHARVLIQFPKLTTRIQSGRIGGTAYAGRMLARGEAFDTFPCVEARDGYANFDFVHVGPYGHTGIMIGGGHSIGTVDNITGTPAAGHGVTVETVNSSEGNTGGMLRIGGGNTAAGPDGDLRISGKTLTWAEAAAESFVDDRGVTIIGAGGASFRRVEPGTWFDVPSVAADPVGNPPAGRVRVWFRSDTKQLKVRESDGTTTVK